MANYQDAVIVAGQAKIAKKRQQFEQRRNLPSVLKLAISNGDFSIPNANELRTSPLRTVDVIFFKNVAAGVGTVKAYNHTGNAHDAGKTNITYYTVVETLSLPKKQGANSFMSHVDTFANLLEMKWKNIVDRHNDIALARTLAFKNQLDETTMNTRLASSGLTWDGTNYAIPVPATDKLLFMADMKSAMEALQLNYHNEYDVICDLKSGVYYENLMNQGAGNQNNTSWQFSDCNIHKTQQSILSASVFPNGTSIWMPKGSLAGLMWNEQLNMQGLAEDIGGSIGQVGTMMDPFGLGLRADVSTYMQRADTSSNSYGGSTQDFVQQLELAVTIGYATDPGSTANDSPIILGGLLN